MISLARIGGEDLARLKVGNRTLIHFHSEGIYQTIATVVRKESVGYVRTSKYYTSPYADSELYGSDQVCESWQLIPEQLTISEAELVRNPPDYNQMNLVIPRS